ncbi:thioredoxin-like protein 1 [Macrosteles quadrilineatus]|uniref:thioredoxin-like protein 1 n=1 Tax=Macrosteles quadrilineatus TaxID=74068 RepID=UPI0023E0D0A1|nr:thioredoxin-like protein 1 [Macrosteles quadrilineatus]
MVVIIINNDTEFQSHLVSNGKLVVVDFTASWCGPCKRIAPIYDQLAIKYPSATFLKVDVNVCQDTAMAQGVTAMPTFIFYKNGERIDHMSGANPQLLEEKIKQHALSSESGTEVPSPVKGQLDLAPFMVKSNVEALNESDSHPLGNCLKDDDTYLLSDCDNQLIIPITFNQAVKIHSIKIKAPEATGPKTIKLFINQPTVLDFDAASQNVPTQLIEVKPSDLSSGNPIGLLFVKFQNVQNLQIFVQDNQDGSDVTRIDYLQLFGSPIITTNMSNFKRVAGKAGEVDH